VARNRKRAKERRARRPQPVATGRAEREETASPIEHATPDVELAEAQLALGRPELVDSAVEEAEPGLDVEAEELELSPETDGAAELAVAAPTVPAPRVGTGNRLITFLQGSWRELQRVQWPDRRQVLQATGVVIGFVILAGVFLGVADFLAGKIMNYVLTGHFK
jgi:preprotein translocase SecE subunit